MLSFDHDTLRFDSRSLPVQNYKLLSAIWLFCGGFNFASTQHIFLSGVRSNGFQWYLVLLECKESPNTYILLLLLYITV